jgi:ribosomal protein S27E
VMPHHTATSLAGFASRMKLAPGRRTQHDGLSQVRRSPRGFPRVRCPNCHHELFVTFSCKQRSTCSSCHEKRALLTSIHAAEKICAPVAHGQVVLTIPIVPRRRSHPTSPTWPRTGRSWGSSGNGPSRTVCLWLPKKKRPRFP